MVTREDLSTPIPDEEEADILGDVLEAFYVEGVDVLNCDQVDLGTIIQVAEAELTALFARKTAESKGRHFPKGAKGHRGKGKGKGSVLSPEARSQRVAVLKERTRCRAWRVDRSATGQVTRSARSAILLPKATARAARPKVTSLEKARVVRCDLQASSTSWKKLKTRNKHQQASWQLRRTTMIQEGRTPSSWERSRSQPPRTTSKA
jgi:hypothetical protein